MTRPIRFHLDENVNPAIAAALARRGVDATTSHETGLRAASDDRQLAYALQESRVLVTHDEDFLILAKQGVEHAGIVYCHPHLRSIGQIITGLLLIHDCLTPEDMRSHVEFL